MMSRFIAIAVLILLGRATQQATRSIPIVMSTLPDPVGEGFVKSLARPGGNTTGLTLDSEDLAGKQLELLKETLPKLSRVGVLRNPKSPGYDAARIQIDAAARQLKLELKDFPVSRREDLAPGRSVSRSQRRCCCARITS
jgi:putative ABC transport system substrate-binding protein